MPKTQQFAAPLPITETAESKPLITITASIAANLITLTETDLVNRLTTSRTFSVTAIDDQNFEVPDNIEPSQSNMIIGVSQRLLQLKKSGNSPLK